MITEEIIKVIFGSAKDQAGQLNDCAVQLRAAMNQMDNILGNLRREWQGEAADQFISKCGVLEERIKETASNLDQIANSVSKAAKAYYDAEMHSLEIARTRDAASGGGGHGF